MTKGTYFLKYFHFKLLSFLSIYITFGKFEAAKSVTFSFDETKGMKKRERKLDKLLFLITFTLPYSTTSVFTHSTL